MKPTLVITTILTSTTLCQAEVLARFTFNDNSAKSSDTSKYSSASTWDLSNSAEANTISEGTSKVHANQEDEPAGISATNVDASDSEAQWQQFKFIVQNLVAGETLTLTTFSYDYITTTPLNFESAVYSNLSGYSGIVDVIGGTSNTSDAGLQTATLSLSKPQFAGLTNGDVVEFRIYLKDGSKQLSRRIHQLDNISLEGRVVSVAESSTSALIGLGENTLILRHH
ncbi:hypothetical protein ACFPK9_14685 [Rubritalea spongiae]|uniref:Uncharacterized protein n=1 Tax=Rubritalea spongiae TaxID=430797 RepID=A0ABW5DXM0_9BACT